MKKEKDNIIRRILSFIWNITKLFFSKIVNFFKAVDNLLISFIAKLKIGKRIMFFTLLLIITVVVFISWQSTNDFSQFTLENESEIIQSEINRMYRDINAKVLEIENYLERVSARDEFANIIDEYSNNDSDDLDEDLEVIEYADLILTEKLQEGFFGFELRDSNFEEVHTFGENINTTYENNPEVLELYERVAEMPVDMNFSFITLSDYEGEDNEYSSFLEIGAIEKVKSSGMFGASGAVLARDRYNYERFFEIILPNPYTDIVQLYQGDEIYRTNYRLDSVGSSISELDNSYTNKTLSEINLIDDDIKELFEENNRIDTYVKFMNLESRSREKGEDDEYVYETSVDPYLVGYIAIRNFHNQPIAYITLIKPLDHMTTFVNEVQRGYIINAVIFILISLLIVSLITRSITKPLKKLTTATKKIAAGDLKTLVEINTKDQIAEVANNFNKMTTKLKKVVGEIIGSSDNVYSMSQELSANTQEASAVSEEVAATSEEIATGTENQVVQTNKTKEILNSVEVQAGKVVESAENVNLAIEKASLKSNQGIGVIKSLSDTMLNIMKEVNNTGEEVNGLRKQIERINTIIDAIDYINEETSLLSLNAAIEAARAGEAGRGFAVVADEIRKLADESNKSVQEIHNIFKEINIAMQQVEKSMTHSSDMAENSKESVINAESSFEDILASVEQVKEISKEINYYVEEQKNSTKEIAMAIDDVHRIAELNAEGADQSAKSNEEEALIIEQISEAAVKLTDMANDLKSLVNIFNV
ncbi:MAG: methyl-accepting chemotaxis protein [Halanaerobiaceae bacterium]